MNSILRRYFFSSTGLPLTLAVISAAFALRIQADGWFLVLFAWIPWLIALVGHLVTMTVASRRGGIPAKQAWKCHITLLLAAAFAVDSVGTT
ncbi:MAG: hypothetical protein KIT18_05760, partial [Burkholderiales bacterium]|nr:hypothetical protein [Burkholderiales bacterium]